LVKQIFVWNCHPKAQHMEHKVVLSKPILMNHQHWNKKLSIEIMKDFGWFYPLLMTSCVQYIFKVIGDNFKRNSFYYLGMFLIKISCFN
jgi:hypothetical protein